MGGLPDLASAESTTSVQKRTAKAMAQAKGLLGLFIFMGMAPEKGPSVAAHYFQFNAQFKKTPCAV